MKHNFTPYYLLFPITLALCVQLTAGESIALEARHLIDYSESGETLFFKKKGELIEISIAPSRDASLLFYVAKGADRGKLSFSVAPLASDFQPVYSYDKVNWHPINTGRVEGKRFVFKQRFNRPAVWIALKPIPLRSRPTLAPPFYTYDRLCDYVDQVSTDPLVAHEVLGQSVQGRDIVLLTVEREGPNTVHKKNVWLQFRVHGNESEQNYILEGLLDYLLEADNPILDNLVIYIVPAINPDGVVRRTRENVNGVDLNRNWSNPNHPEYEQPEIKCVHQRIDQIYENEPIAFGIDFHGWGPDGDGGYRSVSWVAGQGYVSDQTTFLKYLSAYDKWQRLSSWVSNEGSANMARIALFEQHGLNTLTSETSSGRRYDGTPVTEENLRGQGVAFADAIHDYLLHVHFVDENDEIVNQQEFSAPLQIRLTDDDANEESYLIEEYIVSLESASADSETITLTETGNDTGVFRAVGIPLAAGAPVPDDGVLQVAAHDEQLTVHYQDDNYAGDQCLALVHVVDDIPPEVTIEEPASGATFGEGVPVTVSAALNDVLSAIASAELYLDDDLHQSTTSEPYTFELTELTLGPHTLQVRGADDVGNTAQSDPVSIEIIAGDDDDDDDDTDTETDSGDDDDDDSADDDDDSADDDDDDSADDDDDDSADDDDDDSADDDDSDDGVEVGCGCRVIGQGPRPTLGIVLEHFGLGTSDN